MSKSVKIKVGDVLIARKNLRMKYTNEIALIKHNRYIVTSVGCVDFTITSEYFSHHTFDLSYFFTLNDLRKNKLKKLENI